MYGEQYGEYACGIQWTGHKTLPYFIVRLSRTPPTLTSGV